ncbi:MAG: histidine phosphatase family protein [Chloroflexota bacterium]
MKELILARHGESVYSAEGRANGSPAVPVGLTPAGRNQASSLARRLAGEAIDLCITSQFPRARATADIALADRQLPRAVADRLNDLVYGDFEGELLTVYQQWRRRHTIGDRPPGGGESRRDVAARVGAAIAGLVERPEDRILVVCHELPVKFLLAAHRGESLDELPIQVEYATPYRLPAAEARRAAECLLAWGVD